MVKVTFPDGKKKEFKKGATALDVAKSISEGLAREVVACKIDDEVKDMTTKINKDVKITFLKADNPEGLEVLRHSAAHILAFAD